MAKKLKHSGKDNLGGNSPMEQMMSKEVEKGIKMARDPQNAILLSGALRVTNHNSDWFDRECFYCKFKFREEDRIRICPHCDFPLHEDGRFDLKCWSDYFHDNNHCPRCNQEINNAVPATNKDEKRAPTEVSTAILEQNIYQQFSSGIKTEWTMVGEGEGGVEPKIMHSKNDPEYGKKCMMCNEGIRLGDRFVQCPGEWKCCFHADALRHLTCWNARFKMPKNDYCILSGGKCEIVKKR